MKKYLKLLIAILILIAVIAVFKSFYSVQEDEYALLMRFDKVIDVKSEAGLHMKIPFIDSVKKLRKNVQLYDLPVSDVLTSDSKAMSVDSYVMWKISEPLTFYRTLGSDAEARSRLDASTYNSLKNIIGTLPQDSIIRLADSEGKNDLNNRVFEQVRELTKPYGIEVTDVKIKRFDLPSENESAVFERMIAERNRIKQSYIAEGQAEAQKIRNDVDKTVNIMVSDAQAEAEAIVAEGEQEYMRLLAEAYDTPEKQEFYAFIKSLDAVKASLRATAGEQGTNKEKTIVLGPDSDLARILSGAGLIGSAAED
jgi:membrane protease subunit HflC